MSSASSPSKSEDSSESLSSLSSPPFLPSFEVSQERHLSHVVLILFLTRWQLIVTFTGSSLHPRIKDLPWVRPSQVPLRGDFQWVLGVLGPKISNSGLASFPGWNGPTLNVLFQDFTHELLQVS